MRVTNLPRTSGNLPIRASQTIKGLKRQTGACLWVPTRFILRMLTLLARPQSKFLREQSGAVMGLRKAAASASASLRPSHLGG